jgi:hypothetical protein
MSATQIEMEDRLLTVIEAAALLNLSVGGLYHLIFATPHPGGSHLVALCSIPAASANGLGSKISLKQKMKGANT